MDETGKQNLEISSQFEKHHKLLKMALQVLVSLSLLSFILFYSSAISNFFPIFNFHLPLFRRTLERKYMFLICNGIVALVVKTLSFTSSFPSPASAFTDDFANTNIDGTKSSMVENETPFEENEHAMGNAAAQVEDKNHGEQGGGVRVGGLLSNKQAEEIESPAPIIGMESEEKEDEEVEEGGTLMNPTSTRAEDVSTEELNRKFEEFIRKMREELRVEAQQQLIAV
ncbi:hypothetical protein NMG60_11009970 [Bertholletia excelsa]